MKKYFHFRWRVQLQGFLNRMISHDSLPCHNACATHKRCDMKNHILLPCSSKVHQNDVYSSVASDHGVSWLWNAIYIKQITLITFISNHFWKQEVLFDFNKILQVFH